MPTNTLTDAQVKRLQPREKPYKVFDGAGMFLYVTDISKIWRVAYRVNGKQQTKSLGPYPLVSLAQAREARRAETIPACWRRAGAQESRAHALRSFLPILGDPARPFCRLPDECAQRAGKVRFRQVRHATG